MAFAKWHFKRACCGRRAIKLQSAAVQREKLKKKVAVYFFKAISAVRHVSVSGNALQATGTYAANFANETVTIWAAVSV